MSERFEVAQPTSAAFPPRELWLYDPIAEGRLEVIYDPYNLNLVDMNASLEVLLSTIETRQSGYQFTSDYADVHHGEHDEADYPYLPNENINPREFRGLACKKMVLPRVGHAWWHRVFNRPKLATNEGMQLTINAQQPISRFFNSVKYANELSHDNEGNFDRLYFHYEIRQRMGFYASLLNSLRSVPEEFQIISVNDLAIDGFQDVIKIARMFKKYARPQVPLPIVLHSQQTENQQPILT